jgi:hypothetical protein
LLLRGRPRRLKPRVADDEQYARGNRAGGATMSSSKV